MITIVYDNNPFDDRLETAWGFSCIIEGLPETILFDTGGNGRLLLSNMTKLGFSPEQIDIVVLSHIHADHTGGLDAFLKANRNVKVFMPKAFPYDFRHVVTQPGATVVETDQPCQVCDGAWTTGVLGNGLEEQGLYLKTHEGLIVITGCAHPGIARIAKAAARHANMPVYAVLGGFHMGFASAREIRSVIDHFKEMNIQKVGPCHCSGDETRRLMKEAFRERYLHVGVGTRLALQEEGEGSGASTSHH